MTLLLTLTGRASADLDFYLTNPNSNLSGVTGPYVEVVVHLVSSTTADITFTSLTNGGYTYNLAGSSASAVNINASSFSSTWISGDGQFSQFNTGLTSVSGQGKFNLTLDQKSAFGKSGTQIEFQVAATGTNWITASDVLTANNKGMIAAAHVGAVGPGGTSYDASGNAGGDGTSLGDPPISSPEPSTLPLAALVALGFLAYGLRRRPPTPGDRLR